MNLIAYYLDKSYYEEQKKKINEQLGEDIKKFHDIE